MALFSFPPRSRRPEVATTNVQLVIDTWPAAVYAIGDIHGCLKELRAIEEMIVADGRSIDGHKLIVTLGDYVDRGPESSGVLTHLIQPAPPGFDRICLGGNHEDMMLDALHGGDDRLWLDLGGMQTVGSYGIDLQRYSVASARTRRMTLGGHIPAHHLEFLAELPMLLQIENTVFVHAGIRRNVGIEQQLPLDVKWIRDEFLLAEPNDGLVVVHGHTPSTEVQIESGRIGIDTGAFATGHLSAVRLIPGREPLIFTTKP